MFERASTAIANRASIHGIPSIQFLDATLHLGMSLKDIIHGTGGNTSLTKTHGTDSGPRSRSTHPCTVYWTRGQMEHLPHRG